MAFPFGVSWLCALLLWGCICFLPHKGYNTAYGYPLSDDAFSGHAGALGPQTSNQFNSGASLATNQDSFGPKDEMTAMRHQSVVSPQSEPVHHEDGSFVTSLNEEMVQSKPDLEPYVPSTPPVQQHEDDGSDNQHPFGLLVKEHTGENAMEGVSFPTIRDFKRFIETMKSSFLRPGSDMNSHFQTGWAMMENETPSNGENIAGEPDTSYKSNSATEGTSHHDANENEFWSEQGANYQIPSESLSVLNPVDSTASFISKSVHDSQDPGSALYPHHHLAATEHVSSNYRSFDSAGISWENPEIFTSGPYVQNEDFQSTTYKLPEKTPSGSFFGGDLSFSGHMSATPVSSPNSPSEDHILTPLTSEKNIQQPKYSSHTEDSSTRYQKPSGEFKRDFQIKEQGSNVLSAPMPPSLASYGNSVFVSPPRGQHYIPDYRPKQRGSPAQPFQTNQPPVGKEPNDINYTPVAHLPASAGSVSSSSNNLSPQSSSGHVGVQTSSPHDGPSQAFDRKQPVGVSQWFTVKPSSSLHGSSRHDGYLGEQTDGVSRPSMLTAQPKDVDKSVLFDNKPASATQEPKQVVHNTLNPISSGLTPISSQLGAGSAIFNSLTNLAPTSTSERAVSRLAANEIMSRKFGITNMISDTPGARNPLKSFPLPLRRGVSLHGGYVSKPLSAAKVSASTLSGFYWRNHGKTKKLPPKTGPNMSAPPVNAYIVQSKNGYVRSKVYQSKTRYAPYQLHEYKHTLKNSKGGSKVHS
ncbi:uncharacterized protein LOC121950016 [Plectropomus leopardus]|uniref:uncharacterized protein LOC121950016 n=1 Tax=Plectropomus leopardus TaxID=160734 RepID=UPI001C4C7F8A|nr:uncharacterized protein LOC121950016 [Plectropomus leopardus]